MVPWNHMDCWAILQLFFKYSPPNFDCLLYALSQWPNILAPLLQKEEIDKKPTNWFVKTTNQNFFVIQPRPSSLLSIVGLIPSSGGFYPGTSLLWCPMKLRRRPVENLLSPFLKRQNTNVFPVKRFWAIWCLFPEYSYELEILFQLS